MRLTETLREGADTYLAAGDAEASAHALRRANSMAAQVTSQTPNNKFHRAVAGESSLNMAMLATQHPTQMSDVDVPTLVAESQKVFRELYEAEPIDSWINQLKRSSVCEAAAVRVNRSGKSHRKTRISQAVTGCQVQSSALERFRSRAFAL